MAKGLNLRAIFSADTAGIEKGSRRATQSIKAFDKESSRLLDNFGSILGIETGKIGQMAKAIEGLGTKTALSAGKSADAVKKVSGAFRLLGGVIGGVAAVGTAMWAALSREADYYGTRLDGLANNAGLKAYQDTLKALRHDHRDGAGIQEFVARIKRGWSSIGNFVQSIFRGDVDFNEDKAAAQQASNLAVIGTNIAIQELNVRKKVAELDADIAEKRRMINDTSLSYLERQAASDQLSGLINQKANIQEDILEKQLANMKAMHALTNSTLEDRAAEVDLEIQIQNIQRNREQEIRSIRRQQKRLNAETQSWLEAINKDFVTDQIGVLEVEVELLDQQLIEDIEALGPVLEQEIEDLNAHLTPVKLEVDQQPVVKTIDLLPVLEQGFKQTFENIGTYIGEALTGNDSAASNFSAMMLSTMGDMCIKLGELIISASGALEAIQNALRFNVSPYVSAAAGAALVLLGGAVKAGASSIANGGGHSSATIGSSYGTSVDNYTTRDIQVNVTGTLVAHGSQLVAVLNNENKRKSLTT